MATENQAKKVKKKIISLIIVVATISLLGIVFTQLYWMRNAIIMKEEQFDESVRIGLKSVVNQLMENYNDSTLQKIRTEGPECVIEKTDIRDVINAIRLDSLIQAELACFRIEQDYGYGVINKANDRFYMGNYEGFRLGLLDSQHAVSLSMLYEPGDYWLAVWFPNQQNIILKQMILMLILSGFFLLIVISSFSFTIYRLIMQKKLSQMKSDFVNNMTHEFKTPISTISLAGEMLLNPNIQKAPEKISKYSRVIIDENARMQSQVERVLQIAILDKGETKIKPKEIDVHKIIHRMVDNFNLHLKKRNGIILTQLNAATSVIYADRMHFTNIVNNLIDNAAKYTPENPRIIITTKNIKSGILISFEDNGIGISHENQKNIFKKLYRVPTGNLHDVKGFGLGLYYVKTMVEEHGGNIKLHSELGKGSKFEIYLPFKYKNLVNHEEEN